MDISYHRKKICESKLKWLKFNKGDQRILTPPSLPPSHILPRDSLTDTSWSDSDVASFH